MKRLLFLTLLLLKVQADPVPGVAINGPIVPIDSADTYSTLDPIYAQGVFRDAINTTGLSLMSPARRMKGMIVYTSDTKQYWRLDNDLTTWILMASGDFGKNIYNSDGQIVGGPRTVDMNSNLLQFINGYQFNVKVNDTINYEAVSSMSLKAGNLYSVFMHAGYLDLSAKTSIQLISEGSVDIESGWPIPTTKHKPRQAPRLVDTTLILDSFGSIETTSAQSMSTLAGVNDTREAGSVMSLQAPDLRVRTAGVVAGSVLVGQALKLNNLNGKVEFGDVASTATTVGSGTLSAGIFTIATPVPAYPSTGVYPDYFTVDMVPNSNGPGNDKLKVGNGPAKNIRYPNLVPVAASEIIASSTARLVFNAMNDSFILVNPATTLAFDPVTLSSTIAGSVTTIAALPQAPVITNNSLVAAKMSFVNTNSFMASQGTNGAGTEVKLSPLFFIRNGTLQRTNKNTMFEINSWQLTGTFQDMANWQSGGGTGASAGLGGTAGHAGIIVNNTATGAATYHAYGYRNDNIEFTLGNKLYFFVRIRIPTLSVGGGEAFKVTVGFGNTFSAATSDANCIAVTYTDTTNDPTNGGRWVLDCGAATAHSVSDSGVTVATTANLWYDIEVEATTTQVDWWVDGVQKTAVTTNIPTGANRFGPMVKIVGITGSTQRNFQLDQYNAWGVYSYQ